MSGLFCVSWHLQGLNFLSKPNLIGFQILLYLTGFFPHHAWVNYKKEVSRGVYWINNSIVGAIS